MINPIRSNRAARDYARFSTSGTTALLCSCVTDAELCYYCDGWTDVPGPHRSPLAQSISNAIEVDPCSYILAPDECEMHELPKYYSSVNPVVYAAITSGDLLPVSSVVGNKEIHLHQALLQLDLDQVIRTTADEILKQQRIGALGTKVYKKRAGCAEVPGALLIKTEPITTLFFFFSLFFCTHL